MMMCNHALIITSPGNLSDFRQCSDCSFLTFPFYPICFDHIQLGAVGCLTKFPVQFTGSRTILFSQFGLTESLQCNPPNVIGNR